MNHREFVTRLLKADSSQKLSTLLKNNLELADLDTAERLKNICYEVWTSEPTKAQKAAVILQKIAQINPHLEIEALAYWVSGIAQLTKGRFEDSIFNLNQSADLFRQIKKEHDAAKTQVAKLVVLGLLGKYAEAVETGKSALKTFEKYEDELAAGKIEKNLGNITARQNNLPAAIKYYLSARERFLKLNDIKELAMCETNLANMFTELNEFRKAEEFYAQALRRARQAKMFFIEAEIESSMGNLAMFRGKYADALRFLEVARQKFEELKMRHRSTSAEIEIAEIYQTLNLTDEAFKIYRIAAEKFRKLKLQGEEAKARADFGRTALIKKDFAKAHKELVKAARLYALEKNPGGLAEVKLTEANLSFACRDFRSALGKIHEVEKFLVKGKNPRRRLFARWLHGEIARNVGRLKTAERILLETYNEAIKQEQSNLAHICLNSLGSLSLQKNDLRAAENYFQRAVEMIERLRSPLAADEFRMSFLADKLAPFENLTKIYLSKNELERAFSFTEKARARTLSENLIGSFSLSFQTSDVKLSQKLENLREELNWFYSRQNRAEADDFKKLQKEAARREKQIADVMRQIESTRSSNADDAASRLLVSESDALKTLQKSLGASKALIEFVSFDGALSAFVITDEIIQFAANLGDESEVLTLLEGLQFQFDTLRYGAKNLAAFSRELKKRADFYLRKLYEKLIRPLESFIGKCDLVIVPVGATHYVPFHALRAEESYLVEKREIVCAPSAAIWRFLNEKPPRPMKKALLLGYADEKIQSVYREIAALEEIIPESKSLTHEAANYSNYRQNAPLFDILHFACHGQFRPENPMFSNLHLADGSITVRDICSQNLNAALVTLSACETGLNKIYAGDEILGLARGFLSAGADALCLSLWTVSDEATAELMRDFYTYLQRGASVAASLGKAQINFIKKDVHPYFWSPFSVIGK